MEDGLAQRSTKDPMPDKQPTVSPTHKTAILAIILISYVMIVLDISVVLTRLPKIHHELGFTDAGLAWVQSAYTLTFGGFLLLGARAGDILGRRRMFIVGMAIFTLASVAIGASQSSGGCCPGGLSRVWARPILAPSTLALLQTNFDEGEERVRAVSLYSAAAGASASVSEPDGYSLWGSSASARMAAVISSHGVAAFGGPDLPKPATVVVAYASHSDHSV